MSRPAVVPDYGRMMPELSRPNIGHAFDAVENMSVVVADRR